MKRFINQKKKKKRCNPRCHPTTINRTQKQLWLFCDKMVFFLQMGRGGQTFFLGKCVILTSATSKGLFGTSSLQGDQRERESERAWTGPFFCESHQMNKQTNMRYPTQLLLKIRLITLLFYCLIL
jgi:hypothetical protein